MIFDVIRFMSAVLGLSETRQRARHGLLPLLNDSQAAQCTRARTDIRGAPDKTPARSQLLSFLASGKEWIERVYDIRSNMTDKRSSKTYPRAWWHAPGRRIRLRREDCVCSKYLRWVTSRQPRSSSRMELVAVCSSRTSSHTYATSDLSAPTSHP